MQGSRRFRRVLLFLAAALLSALFSDWVIEGSASIGLFGGSYAVHDQRSVICTAAVVAGLVFLCILRSALEKLAVLRSQGEWIEEAAQDISSRWSWTTLGASYLFALASRYAMESARLFEQSGHMAHGIGWLGGPLIVSLTIHAAFCFLAFVGLIECMTALDQAMGRVVAFVVRLIGLLDISNFAAADIIGRDSSDLIGRTYWASPHIGERAPPCDRRPVVILLTSFRRCPLLPI